MPDTQAKDDERRAQQFLHGIGLGRGVERGDDSGKVRAVVSLIAAIRSERDAEWIANWQAATGSIASPNFAPDGSRIEQTPSGAKEKA